jgi:hypothetical protein
MRNVLGRAKTIERVPGCDCVDELIGLALQEEVGSSGTWRDAVHNDALATKIFGEHARHLLYRTFR